MALRRLGHRGLTPLTSDSINTLALYFPYLISGGDRFSTSKGESKDLMIKKFYEKLHT